MKKEKMPKVDMFIQNANHPMRIGCRKQQFDNTDNEIDASKIDFSKKENLDFAFNSLKEMGII